MTPNATPRLQKVYGLRVLVFTLMWMLWVVTSLTAQDQRVNFSANNLTVRQAMAEIETQTGMKFGFGGDFDLARTVRFDPLSMPLSEAILAMIEPDYAYSIDGYHVLVFHKSKLPQETPQMHYINGSVTDLKTGEPLKGAMVEVMNLRSQAVQIDELGYFHFDNVPAGRYILKITSVDNRVQYNEIATVGNTSNRVRITFQESLPADEEGRRYVTIEDVAPTVQPGSVTTHYYYDIIAPDVSAQSGDAVPADYRFIPADYLYPDYRAKAALKTNLLFWAGITPNVSLELSLGRKWTLDLPYAYNPWHWDSQKSFRFWMVQPEGRYWFCNRFEGHFIGLHGIYGQYNVGNFDFVFPKAFADYRYKGWAAGGGISYGYHLSLGRQWAMEFTVGAGYVYLEYDKYRCESCDQFEGRSNRNYFGPTRAGISLVYMIR